jgi:long-subunit fatty acid transport protein
MIRRLLLCGVVCGTGARADVFETFGFGPRAISMVGTMTAEANDYSSVFYNPALLVHRKDANFGLAIDYFRPITEVKPIDPGAELDCTFCTPPDTVGESIGLVGPLGGKLKNRVALGIGLHLPFQRLLHVQLPDPNRPYWYTYQSHSERIEVFLGAGVRIFDWLTVGVGVQALADLVGTGAETRVDLFSKQVTARQIDSELQTRAAPIAGLVVQPIPRLRFGFNYRSEISLLVHIPASVELAGVGVLSFVVEGYTHYSPHSFNLGMAWDVTDDFTLTAEAQYQMWSRAPSPYVSINLDLSGDVLAALGLDTALDLQSPTQRPGFVDTMTGRIAAEFRLSKRFAARGGAIYRPTHVPKQSVPLTNVLDGTAIGAAVGLGFNFDDPLEIFAAPITIDLAAAGLFMLGREAIKEPTDVVPSYRYGGRVLGVTAAVRYDW